ncbi:MAG: A/G-specific adenine glycosylase [Gammaproteobacteria bacterium]|nr:A/G-specific adenine glycosylase [Gammaproteobacteria bacterium]MBT7814376.1 A/G-specific adenine glycosylase [Gammaproteobacteria bacterium]
MNGKEQNNNQINEFSKNLISWHKNHGRHNLPWQKKINPYKIWISEVMLQQTQVKTVLPYYEKFIKKYPTIKDLSNSKLDDILEMWTGLGYYRRAENLYKSSQILQEKYEYNFPESYDDILTLPGVGRSTAGAILSIAYNKKYPILDGNVKRVIKRYFAVRGEKNIEKNLWELSETLLPNKYNNIYTQSIMDLGSLVCLRNNPTCNICPVNLNCESLKLNLTDSIPEKTKKIKRKNLKLYFIIIQNYKNKDLILMKKNSKGGIWANLWSFPSFNEKCILEKFLKENKITEKITKYENIKHNLSHMRLNIEILRIKLEKEFFLDSYYWKNIYDKIGSSKPVISIIERLKEEQKNENGNVLKA